MMDPPLMKFSFSMIGAIAVPVRQACPERTRRAVTTERSNKTCRSKRRKTNIFANAPRQNTQLIQRIVMGILGPRIDAIDGDNDLVAMDSCRDGCRIENGHVGRGACDN